MYKVVYSFADMQDDNYIYSVGDDYPRKGYIPTPERVEELAGGANKIGRPLIDEVKVEPAPKPKTRKKKDN